MEKKKKSWGGGLGGKKSEEAGFCGDTGDVDRVAGEIGKKEESLE